MSTWAGRPARPARLEHALRAVLMTCDRRVRSVITALVMDLLKCSAAQHDQSRARTCQPGSRARDLPPMLLLARLSLLAALMAGHLAWGQPNSSNSSNGSNASNATESNSIVQFDGSDGSDAGPEDYKPMNMVSSRGIQQWQLPCPKFARRARRASRCGNGRTNASRPSPHAALRSVRGDRSGSPSSLQRQDKLPGVLCWHGTQSWRG